MRKFLSIGLAAAMSVASMAVTVPPAAAQSPGFNTQHVQKAQWRGKSHARKMQRFERRAQRHRSWRGNRHWRGGRHHNRHRYHRRHRGHSGAGAAIAGTVLGLALGSAIGSSRSYSGGSSHVNWCLNRYRTYNPRTNLYYYVPGRQRHCNSPYN